MKKSFDDLYKAFEDRFRGSRELITERLTVYLPLLEQMPRQAEGPTLAVDLGCGRGEWLEILTESGFDAIGVDTNARMAQEAIDNGLTIELQDALEYLGGRPDNSVAVISAFHMVEHVPTDYLIGLLGECQRVLAEDGLLILETPNPENISVGTHTFHLDPTHKSPLPPDLLEFLVEQAGFPETAIVRLNGAPMINAGPIERSIHLMFEVARDYACLARKRDKQAAEAPDSLAAFVQSVSQPAPTDTGKLREWLRSADDEIVGISEGVKATMSSNADQLRQLSDNLTAQSKLLRTGNIALRNTVASLGKQLAEIVKDKAVATRDGEIERLRLQIAEAEVAKAEQLALKETAIQGRDDEIDRLHQHIADADTASTELLARKEAAIRERDAEIAKLSKKVTSVEERAQQLATQITAFQNSTSWRVAAPMRGLVYGSRAVGRLPKANARLVMVHGFLWLRRRPRIAAFVQRMVRLVPPVERRLLAFARASSGLVPIDTGWTLEPDPVALGLWRKRLETGKSA